MKRSTYLKQLLILLVVKVLISACDSDILTVSESKGPGGNNLGPDPFEWNNDYYSEENFEYEFAAEQKTKFVLDGVNGNVYVEQSSGQSSFRVSGKKRAFSSSQEDADNQLHKLEVAVENYCDELRVTTLQPIENGERNYSVDYKICLPKNVELQIVATNANVTLIEAEGNAAVEITNGKIDAYVRLPENGELKMKNINGDIKLSLPKTTSARLKAESSNGKVEIQDLNLSSNAENKNSMSGILGDGEGSVELKSTNGNIDVLGF